MSSQENKPNLVSMVENADRLYLCLEHEICAGNDTEADKLSLQYEEEVEKILSYEGQTQECLIIKLDFSKKVIKIDHPVESLVERVFESLSKDVQLLARR